MILKISPDIERDDFIRIIEQSVEEGTDGWCICNSTKNWSIPHLFPEEGGVSGWLLANQSLKLLKKLKMYLLKKGIKDKLVISCGGGFDSSGCIGSSSGRSPLGSGLFSIGFLRGRAFFTLCIKKLLLTYRNVERYTDPV